MNYFCIMKNCVRAFGMKIAVAATLLLGLGGSMQAQTTPQALDSVEISLLTCNPGKEVYSMFGHTAIRIRDKRSGEDDVVNYGIFTFRKSFFVLRFVFGITDYQVDVERFSDFCQQYAYDGRNVVEQNLNISNEDKLHIINAISNNCMPQNCTYRYNFFYDNCTTRARDILIKNISSKVDYGNSGKIETTYRRMIHQWNENYRWTRFGEDLLLGVKADRRLSLDAKQFLPDSLRQDFARATIMTSQGKRAKLVDSTFTVVNEGAAIDSDKAAVTPRMVMIAVLLVTVLLTFIEIRTRRTMWIYDAMLLTVSGLAGIILFAMIFSLHPTVSANLQILCLNPLSIIFAYKAIKRERQERPYWYFKLLAACIVLFFIGAIFQNYAEGMIFLALSLLVRCGMNILKHEKMKKS
jgi:hypothetical protein